MVKKQVHEKIRIADPLQTEPLRLSMAALEWLAESGLSIRAASPFGFLRTGKHSSTKEDRNAAEKEMNGIGIALKIDSKVRPSPEAALFQHAIEIVARPQAQITISAMDPKEDPLYVPLLLADEFVSLGYFDQEAFYVGAPVGLSALASALERKLQNEPDSENHSELCIGASELQLVTILWASANKNTSEPISRTDAIAALTNAGLKQSDAEEALNELCNINFLEEKEGTYLFRAPYDYWMKVISSGHIMEIEYTPLPEEDDLEALENVDEASQRLLFIGSPKNWYLCDNWSSSEISELAEDSEPSGLEDEEKMITLIRPEPADLKETLRNFLGIAS